MELSFWWYGNSHGGCMDMMGKHMVWFTHSSKESVKAYTRYGGRSVGMGKLVGTRNSRGVQWANLFVSCCYLWQTCIVVGVWYPNFSGTCSRSTGGVGGHPKGQWILLRGLHSVLNKWTEMIPWHHFVVLVTSFRKKWVVR